MEYLTVEEVAQRLRVDVTTIYREIKRGRLVGIRVGGRALRITTVALNAYLRQRVVAQ